MTDNLLTPAETSSVFDGMAIRKVREKGEWYFNIQDVVKILTDSKDIVDYIKKLRTRDLELKKGWGQIVTPLAIQTAGGKQKANFANTSGILRIIQSIPSPKAEPFKQWLAQLGNERVQEYNDPELGIQRARERAIDIYKKKGMNEKEIKMRLSGIEARNALTDVWKERNIEPKEYAMLTNLGYTWTGLTAEKLKELKGLTRTDPLRDHFSRPEMLLSELAEETALKLIEKKMK